MNIFKSKSGIKPRAPVIRTTRIQDPPARPPLPSKAKSTSSLNQRKDSPSVTHPSRSKNGTATPPADRPSPSRLQAKRKPTHQKSPQPMTSDSDDDDDNEGNTELRDVSQKRQKLNRPIDIKRRLRSQQAFSEADGGVFEMIHAADVTPIPKKLKLMTDLSAANLTVDLMYPSASQLERYNLVYGNDEIDAFAEIIEVAKIVTAVYLTPKQAEAFKEPINGYIRQLVKAKNHVTNGGVTNDSLRDFKAAVVTYNTAIQNLVKEGTLARNLDTIHELPFDMICIIMRQVYDRAVSPKVSLLKQYEAGGNNVYGELLPKFASTALAEAGLKSDQVFIDLGSGVGNVVLQAALEFGCESWGCEEMNNCCILAKAQMNEFRARCRLWGIKTGKVFLEEGSFLDNQEIHKAMRKADVILVNNQVFTPALNDSLTNLFLEVKEGCKIVSLKSFVPEGHEITSRNCGSVSSLLEIIKKGEYYNDSVSWTGGGGNYFIAEMNRKRLKEFL